MPFDSSHSSQQHVEFKVATGIVVDSLGRRWNPALHPRDSKGRFIETGGIVRIGVAGGLGKVMRTLLGNKVEVQRQDGKRIVTDARQLTMVRRPDGSKPTKDARKVVDEDDRRDNDSNRGDGFEHDDVPHMDDIPDEDPHDEDDQDDENDVPDVPEAYHPSRQKAKRGDYVAMAAKRKNGQTVYAIAEVVNTDEHGKAKHVRPLGTDRVVNRDVFPDSNPAGDTIIPREDIGDHAAFKEDVSGKVLAAGEAHDLVELNVVHRDTAKPKQEQATRDPLPHEPSTVTKADLQGGHTDGSILYRGARVGRITHGKNGKWDVVGPEGFKKTGLASWDNGLDALARHLTKLQKDAATKKAAPKTPDAAPDAGGVVAQRPNPGSLPRNTIKGHGFKNNDWIWSADAVGTVRRGQINQESDGKFWFYPEDERVEPYELGSGRQKFAAAKAPVPSREEIAQANGRAPKAQDTPEAPKADATPPGKVNVDLRAEYAAMLDATKSDADNDLSLETRTLVRGRLSKLNDAMNGSDIAGAREAIAAIREDLGREHGADTADFEKRLGYFDTALDKAEKERAGRPTVAEQTNNLRGAFGMKPLPEHMIANGDQPSDVPDVPAPSNAGTPRAEGLTTRPSADDPEMLDVLDGDKVIGSLGQKNDGTWFGVLNGRDGHSTGSTAEDVLGKMRVKKHVADQAAAAKRAEAAKRKGNANLTRVKTDDDAQGYLSPSGNLFAKKATRGWAVYRRTNEPDLAEDRETINGHTYEHVGDTADLPEFRLAWVGTDLDKPHGDATKYGQRIQEQQAEADAAHSDLMTRLARVQTPDELDQLEAVANRLPAGPRRDSALKQISDQRDRMNTERPEHTVETVNVDPESSRDEAQWQQRLDALYPFRQAGPGFNRAVADDVGRAGVARGKGEHDSAAVWLAQAELAASGHPASLNDVDRLHERQRALLHPEAAPEAPNVPEAPAEPRKPSLRDFMNERGPNDFDHEGPFTSESRNAIFTSLNSRKQQEQVLALTPEQQDRYFELRRTTPHTRAVVEAKKPAPADKGAIRKQIGDAQQRLSEMALEHENMTPAYRHAEDKLREAETPEDAAAELRRLGDSFLRDADTLEGNPELDAADMAADYRRTGQNLNEVADTLVPRPQDAPEAPSVADEARDYARGLSDDELEAARGRQLSARVRAAVEAEWERRNAERPNDVHETRDNEVTAPEGASSDAERVRQSGEEVLPDVPAEQGGEDAGSGEVLPDAGAVDRPAGEGRPDGVRGEGPGERGLPGEGGSARDGEEAGGGTDSGRGAVQPEAGEGDGGPGAPVGRPTEDRPKLQRFPDAPRFQPRSQDDLAPKSDRDKAKANVEALELLRKIQAENRPATPEEQAILGRWGGWGAAWRVFEPAKYPEYKDLHDRLRRLLTNKEWRAAKENALNAHYTDAAYVDAMWDAVEELGFDGGRVLEPGSGSGNFMGFAPDNADMYGIELDPTSAAISQLLYPQAHVRNEPFEKTKVPDDSFDLTIGNVPFGDLPFRDPENNPNNARLHNAAIIKSLKKTRPGGLVAVITSHHTMDADGPKSTQARRDMAEQGDLIAAVRLPSNAHDRAAGTAVVTDMLIFRKREHGEGYNGLPFVESRKTTINGQEVPVNPYFLDHPDKVLGRLDTGGLRASELQVIGDPKDTGKVRDALQEAVREAKEERGAGFTSADFGPGGRKPLDLLDPDETLHEGYIGEGDQMFERTLTHNADGTLKKTPKHERTTFTQVENGVVKPFWVSQAQAEELRRLMKMRDLTKALLAAEAADSRDTGRVSQIRADLNKAYDAYVKKFGPINRFTWARTGRRDKETGDEIMRRNMPQMGGFRDDPSSALVYALEKFDSETQTASKASIFTKRTVAKREIATHADTPEDAITLSQEVHARVDLPEVARTLNVDEDTAREMLRGLVYENHDGSGELIPEAEYLSGLVRQKLKEARAAAEEDPKFNENVAALEAVIPQDLEAGDIDGRLGAAWIPESDVQDFLREILGDDSVRVEHAGGNVWAVDGRAYGPAAVEEWGTDRKNAISIAEKLLTGKPIVVEDTIKTPDGDRRVLNKPETEAANAKAEEMQARFGDWLWEHPERAKRLQDEYNDKFNGIVLREYDTAPLTLPGLSSRFTLRPHQNAAIRRIISEPSALLAHEVGAGKTLEMVAGTMELRRLGMARKPAIVVPNHMLEQFSREFLEAYPNANILAAGTEHIRGDARRRFVARAATGDWDAVILTQTAFQKLGMHKRHQEEYVEKQLADMEEQIARQEQRGERNSMTLKDLQRVLKTRREKLEAMLEKASDDAAVTFEETGIDYLMVDEAHMFKNLTRWSNRRDLAIEGADKATDLDMKIDFLRGKNDSNRVVTFATATPIANSIGEAYTMQQYLRPDILHQAGIRDFDTWVSTFGTTVMEMEVAPQGGYRMKERFKKFRNVPELLRMFRVATDIKTKEDLGLPTPKINNQGDAQNIIIPASEEFLDFNAEALDEAAQDDSPAAMLKYITKMSQASLDLRLVGADGPPDKLATVAAKVAEIHERTKDREYPIDKKDPSAGMQPIKGSLQIAFADAGTPGGANENFNAYDALKDMLVRDYGWDPSTIRFIHDADNDQKKAELFNDCRTGKVNLIIGSRAKMGVGTNIQDRAVAGHHLDCPWRPADLQQSEGRVDRQGNLNGPENDFGNGLGIEMYRYITEGSIDAYRWQTVKDKSIFIGQMMRGRLDVREIDDLSEQSMSLAVATALGAGNPHLLEKAKADEEVKKLSRLDRKHHDSQRSLAGRLTETQGRAAAKAALVKALDAAIAKRETRKEDEHYKLTVDGHGTKAKRAEGAEDLAAALAVIAQERYSGTEGPVHTIGKLGGFDLQVQGINRQGEERKLALSLDGIPSVVAETSADVNKSAVLGALTRLDNRLDGLEFRRDMAIKDGETAKGDVERIKGRIGAESPYAEPLARAKTKADLLAKLVELTEGEGKTDPEQIAKARAVQDKLAAIRDAEKAEKAKVANTPDTPEGEEEAADTPLIEEQESMLARARERAKAAHEAYVATQPKKPTPAPKFQEQKPAKAPKEGGESRPSGSSGSSGGGRSGSSSSGSSGGGSGTSSRPAAAGAPDEEPNNETTATETPAEAPDEAPDEAPLAHDPVTEQDALDAIASVIGRPLRDDEVEKLTGKPAGSSSTEGDRPTGGAVTAPPAAPRPERDLPGDETPAEAAAATEDRPGLPASAGRDTGYNAAKNGESLDDVLSAWADEGPDHAQGIRDGYAAYLAEQEARDQQAESAEPAPADAPPAPDAQAQAAIDNAVEFAADETPETPEDAGGEDQAPTVIPEGPSEPVETTARVEEPYTPVPDNYEPRTPTQLDDEAHPLNEYQQVMADDAVIDRTDVVAAAKAGTGKTSTAVGIAKRFLLLHPKLRGGYLAFNKSVRLEAVQRMPKNVESLTGHGAPFRWKGSDYTDARFRKGLIEIDHVAPFLGIPDADMPEVGDRGRQTFLVMNAVGRYALSADDEIGAQHFSLPDGTSLIDGANPADVDRLVGWARKAWADIASDDGKLYVDNDHIRKMWALARPDFSKPGWGFEHALDFVFLDEAQDTPPVLAKVMADQTIQRIILGDSDQAIYGSFTGSVDYMKSIEPSGTRELRRRPLPKSYRYGPEIADAGNRPLEIVGSPERVIGAGPKGEVVEAGSMKDPHAILVRSNGGMLDEALAYIEGADPEKETVLGVPKGTVGNLKSLIATVRFLRDGGKRPTQIHEDFARYSTWKQFEEAAEKGDDPRAQMLMRLLEKKSLGELEGIVDRMTEVRTAGDGIGEHLDLQKLTLEPVPDAEGRLWIKGDYLMSQKLRKAGYRSIGDYLYQHGVRGVKFGDVPGAGVYKSGKRKGQPIVGWAFDKDKADEVAQALRDYYDEPEPKTPDVIISTVHKAKGLEWDNVKIGKDFKQPTTHTDEETGREITVFPNDEEQRIAYVAMTRAARKLDPGSLAWVFEHSAENGGDFDHDGRPDVKPEPKKPTPEPEQVNAPEPTEETPEAPAAPEADVPEADVTPNEDTTPEAADEDTVTVAPHDLPEAPPAPDAPEVPAGHTPVQQARWDQGVYVTDPETGDAVWGRLVDNKRNKNGSHTLTIQDALGGGTRKVTVPGDTSVIAWNRRNEHNVHYGPGAYAQDSDLSLRRKTEELEHDLAAMDQLPEGVVAPEDRELIERRLGWAREERQIRTERAVDDPATAKQDGMGRLVSNSPYVPSPREGRAMYTDDFHDLAEANPDARFDVTVHKVGPNDEGEHFHDVRPGHATKKQVQDADQIDNDVLLDREGNIVAWIGRGHTLADVEVTEGVAHAPGPVVPVGDLPDGTRVSRPRKADDKRPGRREGVIYHEGNKTLFVADEGGEPEESRGYENPLWVVTPEGDDNETHQDRDARRRRDSRRRRHHNPLNNLGNGNNDNGGNGLPGGLPNVPTIPPPVAAVPPGGDAHKPAPAGDGGSTPDGEALAAEAKPLDALTDRELEVLGAHYGSLVQQAMEDRDLATARTHMDRVKAIAAEQEKRKRAEARDDQAAAVAENGPRPDASEPQQVVLGDIAKAFARGWVSDDEGAQTVGINKPLLRNLIDKGWVEQVDRGAADGDTDRHGLFLTEAGREQLARALAWGAFDGTDDRVATREDVETFLADHTGAVPPSTNGGTPNTQEAPTTAPHPAVVERANKYADQMRAQGLDVEVTERDGFRGPTMEVVGTDKHGGWMQVIVGPGRKEGTTTVGAHHSPTLGGDMRKVPVGEIGTVISTMPGHDRTDEPRTPTTAEATPGTPAGVPDEDSIEVNQGGKGTPEYRAAYERGWRSGAKPGGLEAADDRNEPNAWYDGYHDRAADRPKWTLMHYDSAEAWEKAADEPLKSGDMVQIGNGDHSYQVTHVLPNGDVFINDAKNGRVRLVKAENAGDLHKILDAADNEDAPSDIREAAQKIRDAAAATPEAPSGTPEQPSRAESPTAPVFNLPPVVGLSAEAGTSNKRPLARALKAAAKNTDDVAMQAALENAASALTDRGWATYGGPEGQGQGLAEFEQANLDKLGLTRADVDKRVALMEALADHLDGQEQDGVDLGSIKVAKAKGNEPTIAEYLRRYAASYRKRRAELAPDEAPAGVTPDATTGATPEATPTPASVWAAAKPGVWVPDTNGSGSMHTEVPGEYNATIIRDPADGSADWSVHLADGTVKMGHADTVEGAKEAIADALYLAADEDHNRRLSTIPGDNTEDRDNRTREFADTLRELHGSEETTPRPQGAAEETAVEPSDEGDNPAWVPTGSLQPGDSVEISGDNGNGSATTRTGVVLGTPETVEVHEPGTPDQGGYRVPIGPDASGDGDRDTILTGEDSIAAHAEHPKENGDQPNMTEGTVRSGRVADEVPGDSKGQGVFPGSTVTGASGQSGVVREVTDTHATIRWEGEHEDSNVRAGAVTVTNQARPDGWTEAGQRVHAGQVVELEDGAVGKVESVEGDDVAVLTPEGVQHVLAPTLKVRGRVTNGDDEVQAPAFDAPAGEEGPDVRPTDPIKPEDLPEGVTGAHVNLRPDQLQALNDLGLDIDAVSPGDVQQAAARIRHGLPISTEQATALAAHLRALMESDGMPAGKARALKRVANRLDAAGQRARGEDVTPSKPETAKPERITVADVARGDVIAIPDPSTGEVVWGRVVTKQPQVVREDGTTNLNVADTTIELANGDRIRRPLDMNGAVYRLPDMPDNPEHIAFPDEPETPVDEARPFTDPRVKERLDDSAQAVVDAAVPEDSTPESLDDLAEHATQALDNGDDARDQANAGDRHETALEQSGVDPETAGEVRKAAEQVADEVADEVADTVAKTLDDAEPLPGESQKDAAERVKKRIRDDAAAEVDSGAAVERAQQTAKGEGRPKREAQEQARGQVEDAMRADLFAMADELARQGDLVSANALSEVAARIAGRPDPIHVEAAAQALTMGQNPRKTRSLRARIWAAFQRARARFLDRIRALMGTGRRARMSFKAAVAAARKEWRGHSADEPDSLVKDAAEHLAAGGDKGAAIVMNDEPKDFTERVAYWRDQLGNPAEFGRTRAHRRFGFPAMTADRLASGRPVTPAELNGAALDRESDGGPGSKALADVAAVSGLGGALDDEANARVRALLPDLGSDPAATVREARRYADSLAADARADAADERLRKLRKKARKRAKDMEARYVNALRESALAILAEQRAMGPNGDAGLTINGRSGSAEEVQALRWAEQHFPADWLASAGTVEATAGRMSGYRDGTVTVAPLGESPVDGAGEYGKSALQGLARHMEATVPGLREAIWAYGWQRTSSGTPGRRTRRGRNAMARLANLFPAAGYDRTQVTRQGDWPDAFLGQETDEHPAWWPQAVSEMFAGDAWKDDDLRKFMMGLLAWLERNR